ncbi:hypothetical protein K450DRAFT_230970 [Umbelopsis ramanniana AG]|uniref:C3H1-type domain-containing protein n=1 Tax=Umbelopsis ramanniana AG TaxID=1314678 RepID=A0AAD5EE60_UMBRA|nr:uncharacterized protein K450DRAFT_230970 [Umbelopsis ramanniana AG]KAI8581752.1 hypothetical protein K450DRAFT_230970 [Umbelopsis ramanniana AG]
MEAAQTETTATRDSHIPSSLNPNASAFTPSATPQPASPQQSAVSQAFKPQVKYCYYEQFGQCNKGDACPFTHRSQEQCWYEANGGCKRGAACLFKHTGITSSNGE